MRTPVTVEREGPVAVLVIDHPPVNAMALPVARRCSQRLNRSTDRAVRAIVVH